MLPLSNRVPHFVSLSGHPIRGPASLCAGALGLTAGFIAAYQNSSARLLGYHENSKEVKAEEQVHKKAMAAAVAQNAAAAASKQS